MLGVVNNKIELKRKAETLYAETHEFFSDPETAQYYVLKYFGEQNANHNVKDFLHYLGTSPNATHENKEICLIHPLTRTATLHQVLSKEIELIDHYSTAVMMKYITAPLHLLSVASEYSGYKKFVAGNCDLTPNIRYKLSYDTDVDVRANIAANETTPLPMLERLSYDSNKVVREAVACNKNAPEDIIVRLAEDPSPSVLYYVVFKHAENSFTITEKVLQNPQLMMGYFKKALMSDSFTKHQRINLLAASYVKNRERIAQNLSGVGISHADLSRYLIRYTGQDMSEDVPIEILWETIMSCLK